MRSHNTDNYLPLTITSPAFQSGSSIPAKYTCEGKNISPPLIIKGLPNEVKSLALIVDDPDAPAGTWLHWLVWNIPATGRIGEHEVPGVEGINDFGKHSYGGPCPPSGTHRYFFRVFGLDDLLELKQGSSRPELEQKMRGHIIAYGELIGVYQRTTRGNQN